MEPSSFPTGVADQAAYLCFPGCSWGQMKAKQRWVEQCAYSLHVWRLERALNPLELGLHSVVGAGVWTQVLKKSRHLTIGPTSVPLLPGFHSELRGFKNYSPLPNLCWTTALNTQQDEIDIYMYVYLCIYMNLSNLVSLSPLEEKVGSCNVLASIDSATQGAQGQGKG